MEFINTRDGKKYQASKEDGKKFMEEYPESGTFTSHGATMRGYVLIPEYMFKDLDLLAHYLQKAHEYVLSLDPK